MHNLHAEQTAKSAAATHTYGGPYHASPPIGAGHYVSNATLPKGTEISALEQIAHRLTIVSNRLDDTNRYTLAFIERVNGAEPARPECGPVNSSGGDKLPALALLSMLVDRLEYHTSTADNLSHKLARIA